MLKPASELNGTQTQSVNMQNAQVIVFAKKGASVGICFSLLFGDTRSRGARPSPRQNFVRLPKENKKIKSLHNVI